MSATGSFPLPLLSRVQTASPCPVRWTDMRGGDDERTRHCDRCNLSVHNISKMTTAEAEAFLTAQFDDNGEPRAHRVCARIFRRADGTILTAECPVGVAALRAKARRAVVRIATITGLLALTGAVIAALERQDQTRWAPTQPFLAVSKAIGQSIHGGASFDGGIILLPSSRPSKVKP